MSKVWKCDRCRSLYDDWNGTLQGSIAKSVIRSVTGYCGDEGIDVCRSCAASLSDLIRAWFVEGWSSRADEILDCVEEISEESCGAPTIHERSV